MTSPNSIPNRIGLAAVVLACWPCCLAAGADGRTIAAAGCDRQSVQRAIDKAADGDTVEVPAGQATWTTASPTRPAVLIESKTIALKGAGIDKTVITDGTTVAWRDLLLWVNGPKPSRVTGFTFKGIKGRNRGAAAIAVHGSCVDWRIDHCKFDASPRGIWAYAGCFGVVDNCTFLGTGQGVVMKGAGPKSWERPLGLGLAEAVYIEDCTFVGGSAATDGYHGARFVFRHNTVIDTHVAQHGCDSGRYRSTFSFEVYDNVMENRSRASSLPRAMHFRGGTGVVFNNTLKGYAEGIDVANYRSSEKPVLRRLCSHWGPCDGKNPIDGNEEPNGYPAWDQIGRSTRQIHEPLYQWNNKFNDKAARINVSTDGQHIKAGRDFHDGVRRPGYRPYAYPHPLRRQWPARPSSDGRPPGVPRSVKARALAAGAVELTWEASKGDRAAAGYRIWLDGHRVSTITDPNCCRYVFGRLRPAAGRHTFAVSALDAAGSESDPRAPAAPGGER